MRAVEKGRQKDSWAPVAPQLSRGTSMVKVMTSRGYKVWVLPLAIPGWGMDGKESADLRGVQSSSQTSLPIQVSLVASTTSPKGTVFCSGEKRPL